jgi:DHA1 family bicyclomycin/chloramphenicol resistance-like MFS transporter
MKPGFIITLGLLTAVAALTVDLSLPAIPAMSEALGTSLSRGQQIVGIFMAGMAFGQIPAGLLADRAGRMPILYIGLAIFTVAATVAAITTTIEMMLLARFVQGFGAAFSIVLSRAIVRDVASGQEAARLMSLMTMIFTAAPVIAPSIGALLLTVWDWRMPFIVIAACGIAMIIATRGFLTETHTPNIQGHPIRQLRSSFAEFFSHRQSVFGLLLLTLPSAGFMSIIAISSALAVDIYGFSVQQYGLIFALAGLSILFGSALNRYLVTRFAILTCIKIGVVLIAIAGIQMLIIAFLNEAPFWWVWSNVCLFMFTIAILMANSTVLALDPLPRIAGVASSIIGTMSNIAGATGALIGATIYDGSVRNSVIIMGSIGVTVTLIYLSKPLICPTPLVHHPKELARD